jgi:hypothetical protein
MDGSSTYLIAGVIWVVVISRLRCNAAPSSNHHGFAEGHEKETRKALVDAYLISDAGVR